MTFSEAFDLKKYGWNDTPLHGPCVPAYMLRPELFSGRKINVTVQCGDKALDRRGIRSRLVADHRPARATSPTFQNGNSDGYYDLICELYDAAAIKPKVSYMLASGKPVSLQISVLISANLII